MLIWSTYGKNTKKEDSWDSVFILGPHSAIALGNSVSSSLAILLGQTALQLPVHMLHDFPVQCPCPYSHPSQIPSSITVWLNLPSYVILLLTTNTPLPSFPDTTPGGSYLSLWSHTTFFSLLTQWCHLTLYSLYCDLLCRYLYYTASGRLEVHEGRAHSCYFFVVPP